MAKGIVVKNDVLELFPRWLFFIWIFAEHEAWKKKNKMNESDSSNQRHQSYNKRTSKAQENENSSKKQKREDNEATSNEQENVWVL